MGVCVSVDKKSDSVKTDPLRVASKTKRLIVASPAATAKEMSATAVADVDADAFGFSVRSSGSKDDIFFDSQGWLDSDCEDDFFSVNGEFTPSRGSTPNHQKASAPLTPRSDNGFFLMRFPDSQSEPSPTGRKRLVDLLHENLQSELAANTSSAADDSTGSKPEGDAYSFNSEPKSLDGTPYFSGASSATSNAVTPSRDVKIQKAKAWKTGACCLPGLHMLASDERRHKMSTRPLSA